MTPTEIRQIIADYLSSGIYSEVKCLSCDEAANLLGVKPETVRDWIKCGKLVASKPGKDYIIPIKNVQALIEKNSTNKKLKIA